MDLTLLGTVQAMVADTVVTLPARDRIALAADVAVLVAALAMFVLALVSVRVMLQWRSTMAELRLTVRQNLGPVSDRARSISDNVEFVTQALRTDVTRLNDSVKSLTGRLTQASDHMEVRIEEFNALMEVVQGEAEDIFLDTAATVKGVREGAKAIARPRGVDLTSVPTDALEARSVGEDPTGASAPEGPADP